MRAATASSSGGAEDSASHHALLNQCLNSLTVSEFVKIKERCSRRDKSKVRSIVRLPQRDLDAHFNKLNFITRALDEQYRWCISDVYKCKYEGEPNTFVLTLGFEDANGVRRFYAQGFVRPDGTLATAGGRWQSKFFVTDDMTAYHLGE